MDARHGIERAIALYGQLLDDLRLEEWGELFTQDAVWSMPGASFRGRANIVAGVGAMEPRTPGSVKHLSFTPVIGIESEHSARAWTDLLALARNERGLWEIAAAGRYYDRFVAEGGRWRFASRVAQIAGVHAPELELPPPPSA